MAKFLQTLFDAAAPSAEIGAAFTANQGPNVIPPNGTYLDHILLSITGDIATAAVAVETFMLALSQFTLKAGQETRIQLNGPDLVALMAAFYHELPSCGPDSSTGNDWVFGIKIPVQETIQQGVTYTWSATYAAQTNTTNVKMCVQAVYLSSANGKVPVIAVPISFTTPGSTGMTSINARLQNLGSLIGLLLQQTTNFGNASDVYDIQRIQLVESGKQTSMLSVANGQKLAGQWGFSIAAPLSELLSVYSYFPFDDDPLDVSAGYLEFIADVETVSEAVRLIPIVLKK